MAVRSASSGWEVSRIDGLGDASRVARLSVTRSCEGCTVFRENEKGCERGIVDGLGACGLTQQDHERRDVSLSLEHLEKGGENGDEGERRVRTERRMGGERKQCSGPDRGHRLCGRSRRRGPTYWPDSYPGVPGATKNIPPVLGKKHGREIFRYGRIASTAGGGRAVRWGCSYLWKSWNRGF